MILFLSKLSFLIVIASSSVIHNRREIIPYQVQQESTRVKREVSDSHEWDRICPTEVEIFPLVPAMDDEGVQILQLSEAGSLEYQEFVKVERCRDTAGHVGGVTVHCEQEYLEHTLVIFDPDTGQEKIQRPFFYPSGCSARVLDPS